MRGSSRGCTAASSLHLTQVELSKGDQSHIPPTYQTWTSLKASFQVRGISRKSKKTSVTWPNTTVPIRSMATHPETSLIVGTAGQTICRPATWIDVAKFIILNYATHAVTVLLLAGCSTSDTIFLTLSSFLAPFRGMFVAVITTAKAATLNSSHLKKLAMLELSSWWSNLKGQKHKCLRLLKGLIGIICISSPTCYMLGLMRAYSIDYSTFFYGDVHGQHPVRHTPMWFFFRKLPVDGKTSYHLVVVPLEFEPYPWVKDGDDTEVSSNYSVVKALAAIAQILFASKELYGARGGIRIRRIFAHRCVVSLDSSGVSKARWVWTCGLCLFWFCSLAVPYIVMFVMTGFEPGRSSTLRQRAAVLGWLITGQVVMLVVSAATPYLRAGKTGRILRILLNIIPAPLVLISGISAIVVVVRMILDYGVCVRI
ncbi:hypothetical protein K440DRAFT_637860 [Wilcoxina mikolae CBS 423.85]|nr:hypothetical protein K440DRAFT_637860 [Wilcoxina mikolae CBS 423.85]